VHTVRSHTVARLMPTDPFFYLVGLSAVFLMSLARGAFGGGLAILGAPVLALVVDPITATMMMAPIVSASDPFAVWAFPPRTWSWPDVMWLVPGMLLGLGIGALFFVTIDPRIVALAIAVVTLWFTARWFVHGRNTATTGAPVSPTKAIACGAASGFTTFIAHAGNPPIAFYLLPRGLPITVFAGTVTAIFLVSNSVKLALYLWLMAADLKVLVMAAVLMPAIPLGIWAGKLLHDRIDPDRLYLACYVLLGITGLKLFIDSLRALIV
jgi:uncharacterized protein